MLVVYFNIKYRYISEENENKSARWQVATEYKPVLPSKRRKPPKQRGSKGYGLRIRKETAETVRVP